MIPRQPRVAEELVGEPELAYEAEAA
jgi:hypothetical protein